MSELSPECAPKRTSTDHYVGRHPAGLDLAPARDELAVRALTRFRPPRARGLVGEAAIGSRPGNCFGNCRLNEGPPTLTRRAAAMQLHTYRDESRSRHLDLVDGLRLRLLLADGTAATPRHRASRGGRARKIYRGRVCVRGRVPSITKTERPRSANLLQMPRGPMCKLRQRGRGYGGPAESRGIDPSLQPPPCGGREPVAGELGILAKAVTLLLIGAQKKAIDDHGGSRFAPDR